MSNSDTIVTRRQNDGAVVRIMPDGTTQPLAESTDWERLRAMTDEEVTAAALADPDAQPVTVGYVRWASANVGIPWFAIGGITLQNLDEVLAAGAHRICVVSAILNAPDVAGTCRSFKERLVR